MGMNVHAYTLHAKDTPESRHDSSYTPPGTGDPEGVLPSKWFSGSSKADLHSFLSSGLDLLVISLPLTEKTKHLIGREEFKVMGSRTFVSNIARGPIIVTDDLVDALETDTIRGAALDVTDPEPLPDWHQLWKTKNVIITPHVSGASTAYYARVLRILELNLRLLGEGKELTNKVNRKEGY
jgi:phosphoglycerate dehydrogenase-like enzyme